MTNKILLFSLFLATGSVGYFLGYSGREEPLSSIGGDQLGTMPSTEVVSRTSEDSPRESNNRMSRSQLAEEEEREWGIFTGEELISEFDVDPNDLPPLGGDEIREKLGSALRSDNLVSRNRAIADMLSRLTPENAKAALSVFENTPRAYHTDNNFRLFMHAWGKVDGKAVFDYMDNNPDHHSVGDAHVWAISGWTQSDPQAAFDYVTSREKTDYGLYHGMLRGWGRVDLEGAGQFVANLKDDGLKYRLVSVVGESYAEQYGVQGALDWATSMTGETADARFAGAALDDAIRRAVNQDPSMAAEWISSNRDQPHLKNWMFEHAAGRMAHRDPQAAAAWVRENLDDKRVNGGVVGRVAHEWAKKEPAAAAEWVDGMRDSKVFNKELTERLLGPWAKRDSTAALTWANTLKPELRRPALGRIIGVMPQEQLGSVTEWITNAPQDSVMDGARAAFAYRTMGDNPRQAMEQALRMQDALGREKTVVAVAKKMFKDNPKGIKEWLPESGLSVPAQQRVMRDR